MMFTSSAVRLASRRIATTSLRTVSSASKAKGKTNEEFFRKALPLAFAGGVAAIGATQFGKVRPFGYATYLVINTRQRFAHDLPGLRKKQFFESNASYF